MLEPDALPWQVPFYFQNARQDKDFRTLYYRRVLFFINRQRYMKAAGTNLRRM